LIDLHRFLEEIFIDFKSAQISSGLRFIHHVLSHFDHLNLSFSLFVVGWIGGGGADGGTQGEEEEEEEEEADCG
jgi:hypothetical protein